MRKTCCSDGDSWRVLSSHCRWCGIGHTSVLEESCEGDSDRLTHNFHPAGFKRKRIYFKASLKKNNNTFVISSLGVICFRLLTFLSRRFLLPKEYDGNKVFDGFLVYFLIFTFIRVALCFSSDPAPSKACLMASTILSCSSEFS